ncbi:MAG: YtxH domain-containing protein [Bernardetiaceae bacterium]
MSQSEGNLISFIAGIAVGALIGVLIAPEKGETTREKIADKSQQFRKDLADQVEANRIKIEKFTQEMKEKAAQKAEEVQHKVQETIKNAGSTPEGSSEA